MHWRGRIHFEDLNSMKQETIYCLPYVHLEREISPNLWREKKLACARTNNCTHILNTLNEWGENNFRVVNGEISSGGELVDIEASKAWPCKSGRILKTLRFDPVASKTSGLFVAKFTKLST